MKCDISKGVEPVEIREATRLVIKRGNEYLVGLIVGGPDLRWSLSAYDAWWTRNPEEAQMVARKTGGDVWLFNPVAGQLRESTYNN